MPDSINDNKENEQVEQPEETEREKLDKNATTIQINEMMKDVATTVNTVSNALTENPLYSTYIEFSINELKVLNTSTSRAKNIAVSLINKKNGSGEANTFTLVIAHGPGFSPDFDANALEMALMSNTALIAERGPESLRCKLRYGYSEPFIQTVEYEGLLLNYTMDCQDGILIYTLTGYSGLSKFVESKEPLSLKDICIIEPTLDSLEPEEDEETDGENNAEDSKDDAQKENSPSSDPNSSGRDEEGRTASTEDVTPEGSDSDTSDDSSDTSDETEAETPTVVSADRVKAQPTVAAYWIIQTYLVTKGSDGNNTPAYNCVFGKIGEDSVYASDVAVEMPMQVDKNPMKALTDILNMAVHKSQQEALTGKATIKNEAKITYKWFVSDKPSKENGLPTIYIVAEDPSEYKNAEASFTFNWGAPVMKDGKLQSIVYSFRPKFEGSALIALWDSYRAKSKETSGAEDTDESTEESDTKTSNETKEDEAKDSQEGGTDEVKGTGSFFIKDDGSVGIAQETTAPAAGGNTEVVNANIEQLRSTWVSHVQYPYKADLSTVGIPCEIPIMGVINVNAIVGFNAARAKHHTSGKYQVITTEDVIDASGFRTNWNLAKLEEVTAQMLKDGGGLIDNTIGNTNDGVDTGDKSPVKVFEYDWRNPGSAFANPLFSNSVVGNNIASNNILGLGKGPLNPANIEGNVKK